ncbi:MAG: IS3 family transposase [Fusobacteriaceae bacterium]
MNDTKLHSLITNLKKVHSQQKSCKVLGISRSTYYAASKKQESTTEIRREEFTVEIKKIHAESKGTYGAPKIHAILFQRGMTGSLKYVQRLMRAAQVRSNVTKKYKPQSTASKTIATAPNLLEQNFSTETLYEKVAGDITYIYTSDFGWCYLASFLDLHNNEICGWEFSKKMTTDIVINALKKTSIKCGKKLSGAIIHTDQGSQYTSKDYVAKVSELGCKLSYSRRGNPYDNACIESFHSVIKKEMIYQEKPRTFEETHKALFEYIEGWYTLEEYRKN